MPSSEKHLGCQRVSTDRKFRAKQQLNNSHDPDYPLPPRRVQSHRAPFRLSQKRQASKHQQWKREQRNREQPPGTPNPRYKPRPRQPSPIPNKDPNPHQQHPSTQQAASRQAAPDRRHKAASNDEPAFVTALGTANAYHALKATQTRLQPAVFRLYCNR